MSTHDPTDRHDRMRRIAAAYADARSRAADARRQGDDIGALYAAADAARLRKALSA